ncbi:MAG: ABC transporter substrate-binding protein [Gemmatimonadota bacterium]
MQPASRPWRRPSIPALARGALSTAALSLGVVSSGAPPLQAQTAATEIVFASGPDDSGTVQRLLDAFNAAHRGEIQVVWREMAPENDAHRRELMDALESTPGGIDLLAADVIWTAELAHGERVVDLTDRFYDDFRRDAFLPAPLESATYRLRIWGIPWYTDAGLLFYRRDLLAASGFTEPPGTWDELARMARTVMDDSGIRYGFVFQGAPYEGGTANAAEFIWSAGGDLMTPRLAVTGVVVNAVTEVDSVSVGSPAAARGLDIARELVADGVAPAAVTGFREQETLDVFAAGEAVFLRNWPYAYAALQRAGLAAHRIGIAPIPAASGPDGRSASALGGWNLMINASSSDAEQEAAWTLVRFLTGEDQQRLRAAEAGLLPVLEALYQDPDLVAQVPGMGVGARVFESQLRARPISPFYGAVSDRIAEAFQRVLTGEWTGSEATARLENELRAIVQRNR